MRLEKLCQLAIRTAVGGVIGASLALFLIVFPAAGIRKDLSFASWPWQELSACAVWIVTATSACAAIAALDPNLRRVLLTARNSDDPALTRPDDLPLPVTAGNDRETAQKECSDASASCAREVNQQMLTDEKREAPQNGPTDGSLQIAKQAPLPKSVAARNNKVRMNVMRALPAAGGLFYVFLFCAAAVLCQRIHFGLFVATKEITDTYRTLGVVATSLGAVLQLKAIVAVLRARTAYLQEKGFVAVYNIRHPVFLGWLLVLTGTAMAFGTWFPLLALPGIYVAIKWQLRRYESEIRDKLGESFIDFERRTCLLLPFFPG